MNPNQYHSEYVELLLDSSKELKLETEKLIVSIANCKDAISTLDLTDEKDINLKLRLEELIAKFENLHKRNSAKISNYTKSVISERMYRRILRLYFTGLANSILEGFQLSVRYFGKIYITIQTNLPKKLLDNTYRYMIDWGSSNKKKQALLDSGLKKKDLFSKRRYEKLVEKAIQNGVSVKDARAKLRGSDIPGKNWFVFYEQPYQTWVNWYRRGVAKMKELSHLTDYSFTPTAEFASRVQLVIQEEDAFERFHLIEKNYASKKES